MNRDRLSASRLGPATSYRHRLWEHVPVIGWILGSVRWNRRVRPIAREIDAILAARSPIPIELWGDDPVVRRCAVATLKAMRENMSWTNDRSRPDDDAEVAFFSWADALDFGCVIVDLEDDLALEITDAEAFSLAGGTLGEFVAGLARRLERV